MLFAAMTWNKSPCADTFFPFLHIFWSNLLNKFVTVEHICQRVVKCESWYDSVVLISKLWYLTFLLFKERKARDRVDGNENGEAVFIRVFSFFSFFFFFQTKFICSPLIKGSHCLFQFMYHWAKYFYSRDFIIKNRVLSGWVV